MEAYKQEFIEFMVDSGVLRFGDFVTKSGRNTPFFINTGFYRNGEQLKKLGEYYATAIEKSFGLDFDILFGPAYKGIPLSVATSIGICEKYGVNVGYCSNRKEEKDHGDAGILLGNPLTDESRVVIVEDVTTSGKSIDETMPIILDQGVQSETLLGLVVSVNRMEKANKSDKGALEDLHDRYGLNTSAIVTMKEVIEHLYNRPYKGRVIIDDEIMERINAYYDKYGVK